MSQMKVDVITNAAGNGAPSFTYGIGNQIVIGSANTSTSAANTSTSFAAFDQAPIVTIVPNITGTYKIWGSIGAQNNNQNGTAACGVQITATAGSPTTLFNQVGSGFATANINFTFALWGLFTLTAGVTYTFTVYGKTQSGQQIVLGNALMTGGVVLVAEQIS